MPLVNELVIGLKDKDRFNASQPRNDAQFLTYVTNPSFPQIVQLIFASAGIKAPTLFPRTDLIATFLTGITGINQPAHVQPAFDGSFQPRCTCLSLSAISPKTPRGFFRHVRPRAVSSEPKAEPIDKRDGEIAECKYDVHHFSPPPYELLRAFQPILSLDDGASRASWPVDGGAAFTGRWTLQRKWGRRWGSAGRSQGLLGKSKQAAWRNNENEYVENLHYCSRLRASQGVAAEDVIGEWRRRHG
jgi:hypothetical protein